MQNFTAKVSRLTLALLIVFSSFSPGIDTLEADVADGGSLIKINGLSSVYYLDPTGLRHTFPNESVYFSWYPDFNQVTTINQTELQSYPLSANVTMRPGTKLIKITTDPTVYAVEPGGVLRKVPSEIEAANIYGSNWSSKIVDVPDSFFNNYTVGSPLNASQPPAGTIVKSADTKYFYFDGNKYRQITSAATFHANRFKSENIVSVNKVISAETVGPVIASAENVLSDIHANNTAQGATSYNEISISTAKNTTIVKKPTGAISPENSGGSSSGGGGGGSSGGGSGVITPTPIIDTSAPVIEIFSTLSTSSSLTVPILDFKSTDNIAVTGYLLTETDTTPSATSTWISSVPTTYTFSEHGSKLLYAWSRDAQGNISRPVSTAVEVILPDISAPLVSNFSIPASSTSLTISINSFIASDNIGVNAYLITESTTKPLASAAGWSGTVPVNYTISGAGTKTLYAWAKDLTGNVSNYLSATVTVTLADTVLPQITAFSIPNTSTSLTVSISSFVATDNVAVTGYLITETATKPSSGFTSSPPSSYIFSSAGSKTLYAWAKDTAGNISVSASDTVVVTIADTIKPSISAFTIPTTSSSLTISISPFTATDNIAVTGYLLTETATEPMAGFGSWTSSAPTNYTFPSAGAKTLYAWAKDAAGNVSLSSSDTITITLEVATVNTFYISPSGNDTSGDGSINSPWKSLYKACSSVTTSGKTIHVKAGTYIETQSCNLAVGVNIEGEGITSIIKSHHTTPNSITLTSAAISLVSSASGTTNGNQSISNLKLDGDNLQGSAGILVKKRSNVKVHDITIVDFFKNGIAFWGPSTYNTGAGPYLYDDNNELYNTIISNCGDIPGENVNFSGGGLILIAAQSNLLIHDNTLSEISRAQGHNGNIMNAGARHFKGVKYYNNKSYKPDNEGPQMNPSGSNQTLPTGWNFHLEIWNNEGGFEIYNNEFHGGDMAIDCAGHDSAVGNYDYSWSIHDNLFTPLNGALSPRTSYWGKHWIVIEAKNTYKTLIYNNRFEYGYSGIVMWPLNAEDVIIHDNVFSNSLYALSATAYKGGQFGAFDANFKRISFYKNLVTLSNTSGYFYGSIRLNARDASSISDVDIYNNTIVTDNIIHMGAIELTAGSTSGNTPISGGTLNNINIKNNIMAYFTNQGAVKVTNNGLINGLHVENNLTYNLSNANALPYFWPYNNGTLTNYSYLNNIPTSNTTQQNPLFVSSGDFHLQTGSPAVNAGQNLGLPFNGAAPDMGMFEY